MDIQEIHNLFLECSSVVTDTRKITENSFFIALKGENFDANTFAEQALKAGAKYALIDNVEFYFDYRTILVADTLKTLQDLSQHHRESLGIPIIALTGSNGKTTTKELILAVLSKKFITKATFGNFNNHLGVPLTLLSFNLDTEIGIVEMGANHQKEIEFLCEIAKPDFGYITNFGKAHLEGFGGVEGVIKGKSEMYSYLRKHDKIVFINLDDPIQVEKAQAISSFTFGKEKDNANVNILSVESKPLVEIKVFDQTIHSNLIGLYNANNINAAITIGTYFGVDHSDIKTALENYIPENNRSQLVLNGSNQIILDAYNANPSSMAAALENFVKIEAENKVMFLGDMFELGSDSLEEHKSLVENVANLTSVQTYFIGKDFYTLHEEYPKMRFFRTFQEVAEYLGERTFDDSLILIKGSRGMALERLLEIIK